MLGFRKRYVHKQIDLSEYGACLGLIMDAVVGQEGNYNVFRVLLT